MGIVWSFWKRRLPKLLITQSAKVAARPCVGFAVAVGAGVELAAGLAAVAGTANHAGRPAIGLASGAVGEHTGA